MSRPDLPLRDAVLGTLLPGLLAAILGLGWLEYRTLRDAIMAGFDAELAAVSTTTAAFLDADDHEALGRSLDMDDPRYLRAVRPMRRIRRELDLTYLYTQVPTDDEGGIVYVLDATEGPDFSPPGTVDALPAREVEGARSVMEGRPVHLTGIQPWKLWGLLKSSFAPVRRDDGRVVAMAGADVNIDVITERIRPALALVGAVGLATLLLGTAVALGVARGLEAPVARLRDGALGVAAGDWDAAPEPAGDREVRALTARFRAEAARLRAEVEAVGRARDEADARRRARAELRLLEARGRQRRAAAPPGVMVEADDPVASHASPTGFALDPRGGVVAWAAPAVTPPLRGLLAREMAAAVVSRHPGPLAEVARSLEALVPGLAGVVRWTPGTAEAEAAAPDGKGGWRTEPTATPAVAAAPGAEGGARVVLGAGPGAPGPGGGA